VILQTLNLRAETGWSTPLPSAMDSPQTLVLAFAASEFETNLAPFAELAAAFPRSVLLGCSTSGEIAEGQVHDASISVAVAQFELSQIRHASTETPS
jgi:hypothetical protein